MAKRKKKAEPEEVDLFAQAEQLPSKKQEKQEKQKKPYRVLLPILTTLLVMVGVFELLIWSYIGAQALSDL